MKAIVTGGSRGIGLEIARQLSARGFEVHSLSRSAGKDAPVGLVHWPVDLRDHDRCRAVVDAIGVPEVFVSNAGIMNTLAPTAYGRDEILGMLDVNLITAVRLAVHLAEGMAGAGGGRIVALGSIAGEIGHPDIWYGISKAGLMNAMRALARAYGPRGVVATSVAPGPVETDMMRSIPPERQERLLAGTIGQRFATASEVAEAVCWLATDAPASLNGEVLDLNNGSNCR